MKRKIVLGIIAVVAVLLGLYGRDLLDLYRLQNYISASTEAYEADGGPWPQLTDVCTGCHGTKGSSQHQRYPSLAGQPAPYLAAQLHNFSSGQRINPNMAPLAMTLSREDIDRLANYYAKQPLSRDSSFQPDPGLRDKGQKLVAAGGCVACHGERLMGREQFPRLAGQGSDYLRVQLDAFADGRRKDLTGAMGAIAATLSADERKAIASYLTSLSAQ
ncbi:c-type cytochrome [Pseudomonas chlororaphis]|uniref:c-type cytochrome n=1 Tax=Pseudomonas chlororaphis TaxID=587753 RepID=UPI002D77691F|nr:c-type cytochrome [Pseudomonas chlororaphis]